MTVTLRTEMVPFCIAEFYSRKEQNFKLENFMSHTGDGGASGESAVELQYSTVPCVPGETMVPTIRYVWNGWPGSGTLA